MVFGRWSESLIGPSRVCNLFDMKSGVWEAVGSRPAGSIVRFFFYPAGKLVKFSLLKYLSIPNFKFGSPVGKCKLHTIRVSLS